MGSPNLSEAGWGTSPSNIIDRVRAKVVGYSDYISKPIEADKLLAIISKQLSCAVDTPQEVAL